MMSKISWLLVLFFLSFSLEVKCQAHPEKSESGFECAFMWHVDNIEAYTYIASLSDVYYEKYQFNLLKSKESF
jgi:hypothetical protein